MKTFRPAPPVLRALLALLLLAACSSVPAQAQTGGWRFDHFECTGSTQWTPGSTTQTFPWPAYQAGSPDIQFGLNQYGAPCQSVGTICAVFTWQGGSPPSDSLTVLIFSSAGMYGTPPQPDPDDGFQDPLTPSGTPASKTSSGSHVVKLSNSGGSTTLKTDVYSLSAICGPSDNAAGSGTFIDFQVHIANASLEGHSTADTVGWDASAPRFFSGTACTAKGVAAALSGNVAHAQLCIGENGSDTVVNEYSDGGVPGVPSAASVPLDAMFDSTHFKDKAKIKLTLKVWDTNGGHYEVDVTGPAYNKAYVLTNGAAPGFKYGGYAAHRDIIDAYLDGVNYDATGSSYHRKSAILAKIPAATLLYMSSHANSNGFGDCYDSDGYGEFVPYLSSGNPPSASIQNSIGMKTLDQPPYNFAMVDGCDSAGGFGSSGSFLQGGCATGFGFTKGLLSDQAFVGWGNEMDGSLDYAWSEMVFDNLHLGETLLEAIDNASAISPPIGPPPGSLSQQFTHPQVYISPIIVGDPWFKLHGVYLSDSPGFFSEVSWFRPLR